MYSKLLKEIIQRSLKIPKTFISVKTFIPVNEDDHNIVRQLDSALMLTGFKLSKRTLEYFNSLSYEAVKAYSVYILAVVKELIGDNVKHNAYFINFPKGVPSTVEFWTECIIHALRDEEAADKISYQLATGVVNLLDLPKYGKYQHSYEDMVANHEQFIDSMKDRVTVLHLGKTIQREAEDLYYSLAECTIPLNEHDMVILRCLAKLHLLHPQPSVIPVRENKAIINTVRLANGHALLVDTPTDVLRLACLLSDGDVTLLEKTKFKSFPRKIRRELVGALDNMIKKSPSKLGDVNQYREQWKRLGEHLHVHEYDKHPNAQDVFAVARRDKRVQSIAGKIEMAFLEGDINKSISLLSAFPGLLFRNLDRIVRQANPNEVDTLIQVIQNIISKIATRLLFSVREQLHNRLVKGDKRVFINKKNTVWVSDDHREVLNGKYIEKIFYIIDKELHKRMKPVEHLVVDKSILNVTIPLSNKGKSDGFAMMPRGSVMPVSGETVRFFIYWKQKLQRTDYDLSAILLDENFGFVDQLSFRSLKTDGGVHSGDITTANNGASEFIDIDLTNKNYKYIIPSVNIYAGEDFTEIEEVFFGFMERTKKQKGKPFEPRTVKTKFDIRGKGNVALPLVFIRDNDNKWVAKWLNMYLNGMPNMNMVENNMMNTSLSVRTVVKREYLGIGYLIDLWLPKSKSFSWYNGQKIQDNTTFVGINAPEGLPKDTTVFTINNVQDMLPV